MIERLMNPEYPYGEPKYSELSVKISELKGSLCGQLNQDGKDRLEQLADAYMRQENAALCGAFAEGFWAAVMLMLEFEGWKQHSKA